LLATVLTAAIPQVGFAHDAGPIDKLVAAIVAEEGAGKKIYPENFRSELDNESLNVNDLLGAGYPDGIAYAGRAWKRSKVPFAKIKELLKTKGGIFKISSAVKTQHNFKVFAETPTELKYQLDIKVPIFDDFRTQSRLWTYEDKKGRGILEWQQPGSEGDLTYNRGLVIAEPDGEGSKLFVLGVHVIKPERKIPWIARGTAKNVAKQHYSHYLTAIETVLDQN
jgi:hypothetical protein